MLSLKNFTASPLTTMGGAVLGMAQAATIAAAAQYKATGNTSDPSPYITAACIGAATFLIGSLLPDSGAPAVQPDIIAALAPVPEVPAVLAVPAAPEPDYPKVVVPNLPPELQAAVAAAVQAALAQQPVKVQEVPHG